MGHRKEVDTWFARYDNPDAYALVHALDVIDGHSSGVDRDAPIVLVGGGAQGSAWQQVIADLSGRAIAVPDATERLVEIVERVAGGPATA